MDSLKDIPQLIRLNKVLEMIPVGKSSWWNGVKSGLYPKPVYVGPRMPAWHLAEIVDLTKNGIRQQR